MQISIITVVLNDVSGLSKTMRSVAGQTFSDWELLIQDGASTDGTKEHALAAAAHNEKIKVASEVDGGIYPAMNKALGRASGEYLLFLNAGDSFAHENALKEMKEAATVCGSSIVYFSSWFGFPSGRKILRSVKAPEYIWHGQPATHQATLFNRELHLKHLFPEDMRVSGDYDVLCSMVSANAVAMSSRIEAPILFDVSYDAASFRGQARSRHEMWVSQKRQLGLSLSKRVVSFVRRWFAQSLMRLIAFVNFRRWL